MFGICFKTVDDCDDYFNANLHIHNSEMDWGYYCPTFYAPKAEPQTQIRVKVSERLLI